MRRILPILGAIFLVQLAVPSAPVRAASGQCRGMKWFEGEGLGELNTKDTCHQFAVDCEKQRSGLGRSYLLWGWAILGVLVVISVVICLVVFWAIPWYTMRIGLLLRLLLPALFGFALSVFVAYGIFALDVPTQFDRTIRAEESTRIGDLVKFWSYCEECIQGGTDQTREQLSWLKDKTNDQGEIDPHVLAEKVRNANYPLAIQRPIAQSLIVAFIGLLVAMLIRRVRAEWIVRSGTTPPSTQD